MRHWVFRVTKFSRSGYTLSWNSVIFTERQLNIEMFSLLLTSVDDLSAYSQHNLTITGSVSH